MSKPKGQVPYTPAYTWMAINHAPWSDGDGMSTSVSPVKIILGGAPRFAPDVTTRPHSWKIFIWANIN